MKIGFVGLGIMGRPMCKNLLKAGLSVTAYDPFAAAALDDVVACGAIRGKSNADVAANSDVVITMVPNSPTFGRPFSARTASLLALFLSVTLCAPVFHQGVPISAV